MSMIGCWAKSANPSVSRAVVMRCAQVIQPFVCAWLYGSVLNIAIRSRPSSLAS